MPTPCMPIQLSKWPMTRKHVLSIYLHTRAVRTYTHAFGDFRSANIMQLYSSNNSSKNKKNNYIFTYYSNKLVLKNVWTTFINSQQTLNSSHLRYCYRTTCITSRNNHDDTTVQAHQITCTVWVKKIPPRGPDIFHFFHKRLRICNRFLHTY